MSSFSKGLQARRGLACATFFGLAAALLACSCSKRETPADAAAREKILMVGNAADPECLDPALTTGLAESKILNALFEGLVTADSRDLSIRPAAAKSWKILDGGRTYEFEIDESARWSNGDRLSARDFEFAWRRVLNPKIGAEYASIFDAIKNAKKIRLGQARPEELGAKAAGDSVLRVELERPVPNFLEMLTHTAFMPLHRPTLEKFGAAQSRDAKWTRPGNMVSNGPFVLKYWSISDKIRVEKNPLFRAAGKVRLNGIIFYPISNINTEDRAFRAGQLHVTDSVAPMRLDAIRRQMPECLRNTPVFGVYYYMLNAARPPLNDPRVRKALAISINRAAIIDNFLRGGQAPALSFVPPGCGGYETGQSAKFSEDAAEARRLLAEAGFPGGAGFPRLRLTYNTSEQHKPIAEAVQQMWKKNLGIDVELYNLSWPAYLDARKRGDFDIARASWIADFPDPENFLENFESGCARNHSSFSDARFDALMSKSRLTPERGARLRELAAAEERLTSVAAMIPIYFYSRLNLVSPSVANWHANALDYRNWQDIDLVSRPSGGN